MDIVGPGLDRGQGRNDRRDNGTQGEGARVDLKTAEMQEAAAAAETAEAAKARQHHRSAEAANAAAWQRREQQEEDLGRVQREALDPRMANRADLNHETPRPTDVRGDPHSRFWTDLAAKKKKGGGETEEWDVVYLRTTLNQVLRPDTLKQIAQLAKMGRQDYSVDNLRSIQSDLANQLKSSTLLATYIKDANLQDRVAEVATQMVLEKAKEQGISVDPEQARQQLTELFSDVLDLLKENIEKVQEHASFLGEEKGKLLAKIKTTPADQDRMRQIDAEILRLREESRTYKDLDLDKIADATIQQATDRGRFCAVSDELCRLKKACVYLAAERSDISRYEERAAQIRLHAADLFTRAPQLRTLCDEHVRTTETQALAEVKSVRDLLSTLRNVDQAVSDRLMAAAKEQGYSQGMARIDYEALHKFDAAPIVSFLRDSSPEARGLAARLFQKENTVREAHAFNTGDGGSSLRDWIDGHSDGIYLRANPEMAQARQLATRAERIERPSLARQDPRLDSALAFTRRTEESAAGISQDNAPNRNALMIASALDAPDGGQVGEVISGANRLTREQWDQTVLALEKHIGSDPLPVVAQKITTQIDALCHNLAEAETAIKVDLALVERRKQELERFMQSVQALRAHHELEIRGLNEHQEQRLKAERQVCAQQQLKHLISREVYEGLSSAATPKLALDHRLNHFIANESGWRLALAITPPGFIWETKRFLDRDFYSRIKSAAQADQGQAAEAVTQAQRAKLDYIAAHGEHLAGIDLVKLEKDVIETRTLAVGRPVEAIISVGVTSSAVRTTVNHTELAHALQQELIATTEKKQQIDASVATEVQTRIAACKKQGTWFEGAGEQILRAVQAEAEAKKRDLDQTYQDIVRLTSERLKSMKLPDLEEAFRGQGKHAEEQLRHLLAGDVYGSMAAKIAEQLESHGIMGNARDIEGAITMLHRAYRLKQGIDGIRDAYNHYANQLGIPDFGKSLDQYATGHDSKARYLQAIRAKINGQVKDGDDALVQAADLLAAIETKKNCLGVANHLRSLAQSTTPEKFQEILALAAKNENRNFEEWMQARYSKPEQRALIQAALACSSTPGPETDVRFHAAKLELGIALEDKKAIIEALGIDEFKIKRTADMWDTLDIDGKGADVEKLRKTVLGRADIPLRDALLMDEGVLTQAQRAEREMALQSYLRRRDAVLTACHLTVDDAEAKVKKAFSGFLSSDQQNELQYTDVVGIIRNGHGTLAHEIYKATIAQAGTDERRVFELMRVYSTLGEESRKVVQEEFNRAYRTEYGMSQPHGFKGSLNLVGGSDLLRQALEEELTGHDEFEALWLYDNARPHYGADEHQNFLNQMDYTTRYLNARFVHESSGLSAPLIHYGQEAFASVADKTLHTDYAQRRTLVDIAIMNVGEMNRLNAKLQAGQPLTPAEEKNLQNLCWALGISMQGFRVAKDAVADGAGHAATFVGVTAAGFATGGLSFGAAVLVMGTTGFAAGQGTKILLKGDGYGGWEEAGAGAFEAYGQALLFQTGNVAANYFTRASRVGLGAGKVLAKGTDEIAAQTLGRQVLGENVLREAGIKLVGEAAQGMSEETLIALGRQKVFDEALSSLATKRALAEFIARHGEEKLIELGTRRLIAQGIENATEEQFLAAGVQAVQRGLRMQIGALAPARLHAMAWEELGTQVLLSSSAASIAVNTGAGISAGTVFAAGSPILSTFTPEVEQLWREHGSLEVALMMARQGKDRMGAGAFVGGGLALLIGSGRELFFRRADVQLEVRTQLQGRLSRIRELEDRVLSMEAERAGEISYPQGLGLERGLPRVGNADIVPPGLRAPADNGAALAESLNMIKPSPFHVGNFDAPSTKIPAGAKIITPQRPVYDIMAPELPNPQFLSRQTAQQVLDGNVAALSPGLPGANWNTLQAELLQAEAQAAQKFLAFQRGSMEAVQAELAALRIEAHALEHLLEEKIGTVAGIGEARDLLANQLSTWERELQDTRSILERNREPWSIRQLSEGDRLSYRATARGLEDQLYRGWQDSMRLAQAEQALTGRAAPELQTAQEGWERWRHIASQRLQERQELLNRFFNNAKVKVYDTTGAGLEPPRMMDVKAEVPATAAKPAATESAAAEAAAALQKTEAAAAAAEASTAHASSEAAAAAGPTPPPPAPRQTSGPMPGPVQPVPPASGWDRFVDGVGDVAEQAWTGARLLGSDVAYTAENIAQNVAAPFSSPARLARTAVATAGSLSTAVSGAHLPEGPIVFGSSRAPVTMTASAPQSGVRVTTHTIEGQSVRIVEGASTSVGAGAATLESAAVQSAERATLTTPSGTLLTGTTLKAPTPTGASLAPEVSLAAEGTATGVTTPIAISSGAGAATTVQISGAAAARTLEATSEVGTSGVQTEVATAAPRVQAPTEAPTPAAAPTRTSTAAPQSQAATIAEQTRNATAEAPVAAKPDSTSALKTLAKARENIRAQQHAENQDLSKQSLQNKGTKDEASTQQKQNDQRVARNTNTQRQEQQARQDARQEQQQQEQQQQRQQQRQAQNDHNQRPPQSRRHPGAAGGPGDPFEKDMVGEFVLRRDAQGNLKYVLEPRRPRVYAKSFKGPRGSKPILGDVVLDAYIEEGAVTADGVAGVDFDPVMAELTGGDAPALVSGGVKAVGSGNSNKGGSSES